MNENIIDEIDELTPEGAERLIELLDKLDLKTYKPIPTIKPGTEGYQPIELNPLERCHASHRGCYTCTVNKHHTTNHAAHTPSIAHGYVIAHTWPQALMSSRKRERENEQ